MIRARCWVPVLSLSALCTLSASFAQAQGNAGKPTPDAAQNAGQQPPGDAQAKVASKTAKLGSVAADDAAMKTALGAKDLAGAKKATGKDGAFRGKVIYVFVSNSGKTLILNFDQDYKSALCAVLKKDHFAHFPDLRTLAGKEVLITGKFIDFEGRSEIELTDPGQIRVVK